jgi:hypothetical protein
MIVGKPPTTGIIASGIAISMPPKDTPLVANAIKPYIMRPSPVHRSHCLPAGYFLEKKTSG